MAPRSAGPAPAGSPGRRADARPDPGVEQSVDLSTLAGLSAWEARQRLEAEGANELPSARRRGPLHLARDVLREPMLLLLVAAGAVYLLLGDTEQALLLLGSIVVIMGITFYQERKTERALEALRDLSSPRALVVRDGRHQRIPGREVVRGDLLVVAEGDRVPADAVLVSGPNVSVDESLLTGESVPVRKVPWEGRAAHRRPGGDDQPFLYSGTLVVRGQGFAQVRATGAHAEIGTIGRALQAVEPEDTPLQRETRQLVRKLATVGVAVCAVFVVVYGLTRGNWLDGLLAGVALAMSLLPEEFPVVLTVFLALGAWRIAQHQVLTRRAPAVETLGSATVLCVDKTGTLTLNRMAISKILVDRTVFDLDTAGPGSLPDAVHEVVEFGILAGQQAPVDPMERAFWQLRDNGLAAAGRLHADWTLVREYPLSRRLLAMSRVWATPGAAGYVLAAKGAPEAVADLCRLDAPRRQELAEAVHAMAEEGLRVLGVARGHLAAAELPAHQHELAFEFLGLVALADPVRPGVPAAIQECYAAGIRVVMITGDHPSTARNIGRRIGLRRADEVLSGPELDALDDAGLRERVKAVDVFARVMPEQKLRLVSALQANGEVVAMTGDGVNDAPALKAAHIGIALGGRGTDVAREAAAIVLLDDDFSSIVQAVRVGRRIYDNLKKAMAYLLAIHVPIAGIALVPVVFGLPLVLLPAHIVFLELIIDPACSIAFEVEPEEGDVMRRPPRKLSDRLFNRRTVGLSLIQGASALALVVAVYALALARRQGEQEVRALAFSTLVVANLSLILTNRSWSRTILAALRVPNPALWWVIGGAAGLLGLVLYLPFLRALFRFAALRLEDLLVAVLAGLLSVLWFEALKLTGWLRPEAARWRTDGERGDRHPG